MAYDDEFENDSELVKSLRKQLKDKSDAEKAAADQLASLSRIVRERSIKDVLSEKGIPVKVAALIPADVEPTEEAVNNWVSEYADVFGIQAGTPANVQQAQVDQAAFQRAAQVERQGFQAPALGDESALLAQITGAKSEADVLALIKASQR